MTLHCENCTQTILPTDTVCWHCGWELKPIQAQENEQVKTDEPSVPADNGAISITAVAIFTFITLTTLLLLIIVTNILAQYPGA